MRLKLLGVFVLSILGAVVVVGCGSSGGGEEEALEQKVHKLSGQLASVRRAEKEVISRAKAAQVKTEDSHDAIIAKAEGEATKILGHAKNEAQKLANVEGQIASEEERLTQIESSVSGAREVQAKSTIPGSGIFKAEVDFIPGIYESEGGNGCYWATLNSANTEDIADNENAEGPQIVEIDTPYFQSSGCDKWTRTE